MTVDSLPEWLRQFNGRDLEAAMTQAAILATQDSQGWPHLAYLSAGEILARSGGISLALWPASRTAANLRLEGRAILHVAWEGVVWEARLALHLRDADAGEGHLLFFDGVVTETRRHAAPYAEVETLISFRLHDEPGTLARWKLQLDRLRVL